MAPTFRSLLTLVVLMVLAVMVVGCIADDPEPVADPATTLTTDRPTSTPTTDDQPVPDGEALGGQTDPVDRLPSGPLYAPSILPDGWTIQALQLFGPGFESDERSKSFVVHRAGAGFEAGGVALAATTYGSEAEALEALQPWYRVATTDRCGWSHERDDRGRPGVRLRPVVGP